MNDSMIVEQFKALGDPVRWAIVRELRGGTRCACVLAEVAEVSAPLLSLTRQQASNRRCYSSTLDQPL